MSKTLQKDISFSGAGKKNEFEPQFSYLHPHLYV